MIGKRTSAGTIAALLLMFAGPVPGWAASPPPDGHSWYPSLALADQPNDAVGEPSGQPAPWQPPPVDMTLVPPDATPSPPEAYQPKTQCLQSGTNGAVLTNPPAAQTMLDIGEAQQQSTGRGVTVAIIDTGVNKHPFLSGRLTGGGDYVAPTAVNNGTVDCDGHGTITAGIVAANTKGAGVGFTGVAPDADVLAIRQSSSAYETTGQTPTGAGNTLSLAQAIVHAVDHGANVITTSVDECLTVPADGRLTLDANDRALQAAVHFAVLHNVVVVNSAGNLSSATCPSAPQNANPDPNRVSQVQVPAVFSDDVLSVASVDPANGNVSSFSVWGPWVSVAAPGEGIISIDPAPGASGLANLYSEPGTPQPQAIQGTSFAAPYVAGLAALLRSKYKNMSAREIMYRIEATAQHPSGPDGRNNQVGYGLIDPVTALTALIPGQNGVPLAKTTSIKAQIPNSGDNDSLPMRVALIGTGAAAAVLLVLFFLFRTRKSTAESRPTRRR
ncbi:MAG TPA: type VII secretion-associated serine protease mycosin [Pseudonocardiaceae bacterium]|nr:type VII secretion-associated serine protease mycosin [Pseudonocardiaceae bacterium]